MRRITFAVMSTIAAVVLLLSYRTSVIPVQNTAAPELGGAPAGVVPGNGAAPNPGASNQAGAGPTPDPQQSQGQQDQGQQNQQPNQDQQNQQQPDQGQQQNQQPVTINGGTAQTVQGPVQVQVTIAAGRIADIKVLQRPSGDARHEEVSAFSLPKLKAQALQAQSAQIDGVSGATATSGGYRSSLQSALDAANFG